ncbi:SCA7-domain-containing protein [Auriscalpium vulgare]|uniref:SCA7-domain-containing protein n=1 Tax=Auriscalpium vulgare TaxID=40419 RepID=A0ACB8RPV0_9AGAM|nr:SCA7-domain-containing protein [Auriscalpium vulgare]
MTIKLSQASPSPPPLYFDRIPSTPPPASPATSVSNLPSPPTQWLPARDMKIFGAEPLRSTGDIGIVQCKDCGKPILRSAAAEHAETCKTYGSKGKADDAAKGKKRKADELDPGDANGPKSKKAKPAPKVTKGRFKGPVDLDRQCGVINDKNLPCSRSLTCKSHSMGAKRAVQGRSRKYDDLLLDWNREHNPNFVEPVKRESKKEKKEKKDAEKRERKQRELEELARKKGIDLSKPGAEQQLEQLKQKTKKTKKSENAAAAAAAAAASGTTGAGPTGKHVEGDDEFGFENLADLDSDEELDSMAHSVRLATQRGLLGVPLAVTADAGGWFVVRRERLRSCRDLFAGALLNKPGAPGAASSIAAANAAARLTSATT